MQTLITDSPAEAAGFINRGEIVAFPTETVYGLGADITNESAVRMIFKAKGRPQDNPLIIHIHDPEQVSDIAETIPAAAQTLMTCFFPGPLTLVLKKKTGISSAVTAGLATVGIRCPENPVTRAFLRCCAHPVAAPSANISGKPSSTDWRTVYHDLHGKISCILKGKESSIGLESTIVDCSTDPPALLRAGAISLEQLRSALPDIMVASAPAHDEQPRSPGLKYLHYSPSAAVIVVDPEDIPEMPDSGSAYIGLTPPQGHFRKTCLCSDIETYAFRLFRFFRECDRDNIATIYCERPPQSGIGRAIRDRLKRAGGEH